MKNIMNEIKEGRMSINGARATLSASKSFDLLVFIGRFQPFHKGHERVVQRATLMSKNVLVLAGSAETASSIRNPFSFNERKEMINSVFPEVIVEPINDYTYNDTKWVTEVQRIVTEVALKIANPDGFGINGTADIRIGLIGCEKDHSSYYLKLFPQWDNVAVEFLNPLNATDIRNMWYNGNWSDRSMVPEYLSHSVFNQINEMFEKQEKLSDEYDYLLKYEENWGNGPFLTCDALVQAGGNILLIKRGKEYGHGLYALPGGFLNNNEKFLDGAIRELKEETRLKVPVPVLKGSLVNNMVFDDPHRSERGRIITQCFHFKLENEMKLPEVRGSDDADWAGFVEFGALIEEDFFEDHYHIIRKMIGV